MGDLVVGERYRVHVSSSGFTATASSVPREVHNFERSVPEFEAVHHRCRDVAYRCMCRSGTGHSLDAQSM
ncbi:hypothetical protein QV65_07655 [Rhodococcus erythropolis]|nr:hypothetical protein QV65_07655 [Rhodococcus erythropolis]